MGSIKLNLKDGGFVTSDHQIDYIEPAREGYECKARCPESPHYRCTLDPAHVIGGIDHAAHGWKIVSLPDEDPLKYKLPRRRVVMFARWSV